MRIYLDNCCFNRPFDNQNKLRIKLESEAKLFIQQKIFDNQIEMVWSYILDYENDANPFAERKESIKEWRKHAIIDIKESEEIIKKAKFILSLGVKSKDALHVACAIVSNCDYFLTTDDLLLKKLVKTKEITAINPLSFILIMEE